MRRAFHWFMAALSACSVSIELSGGNYAWAVIQAGFCLMWCHEIMGARA